MLLQVIFLNFAKDFFGEKNPKRQKFGAHFWLGEVLWNHYFDDVSHWMELPKGIEQSETAVSTDEFVRNPNLYGYFSTIYTATSKLALNFTGTYTGQMMVPLVVSGAGAIELQESDPFMDMNIKAGYHFDLNEDFHLELSAGVKNSINSYQDDFESGAARDSDYVYGPSQPRTFFVGVKIGNSH
jgi:outer membrane receptor for ferrienterochelin and colicins